jgi:hypothetical protein
MTHELGRGSSAAADTAVISTRVTTANFIDPSVPAPETFYLKPA